MASRRWFFRAGMLGLAVAIAIGGYLWHERKPNAGRRANAMYNVLGQRLSPQAGNLRLVSDPFTVYRTYPNQRTQCYDIDEHGFRRTSDDTAGALAFVMGGSTSFGHSIPTEEQTFAALLDRRLARYHVRNAGVIGFLSGQELAYMVHHLDDFRPALYIVVDGWNEIFAPYLIPQSWPAHTLFGVNNNFVAMTRTLATYVADDPTSNPEALEIAPAIAPIDEETCLALLREEYTANLGRMAAFAEARGARLLVVFQPEAGAKRQLAPEEAAFRQWKQWRYREREIPRKYRELVDHAVNFCTERGIATLDLLGAPELVDEPSALFRDVVHPNARGHELIAELIFRELERLGW